MNEKYENVWWATASGQKSKKNMLWSANEINKNAGAQYTR